MSTAEISYGNALALLEGALASGRRAEILDALLASGDAMQALKRLRGAMKTNTFPTLGKPLALERVVRSFDAKTRTEGFHVLASWDYRAHRFAEDIVPVLMLDRGPAAPVRVGQERAALSVLLDQYFLSILGLVAVRAWDDGDANANLDRVATLVAALNGPSGSGHRVVDDAETLLLLAISHYHPHESAYDTLIDRVWTLDERHGLRLASACASTLGGHLRWGHRFMYERDVGRMRADNAVDYPWLLFSTATLMRAYDRAGDDERRRIAEPLLNGLSADPWCFTGSPPTSLERHRVIHDEVAMRLKGHRDSLCHDFAAHRPSAARYTPLGFLCNFLCNAVVAMVATALEAGARHPSLNDLFTAASDIGTQPPPLDYARLLMRYAAGHGGRDDGAALIVYDPYEAQTAFNNTMRVFDSAS